MNASGASGFELPRNALKIVFLPLGVLVLSFILIKLFGGQFDNPAGMPAASGHFEAAGRLKMLAAWLLLTAVTAGCLVYFFRMLRMFGADTRGRMRRAYFWLALLGVVLVAGGGVQGAPNAIGEHEICGALGGSWTPGPDWMIELRRWLDFWPACTGFKFEILWWLNEFQKFALALLTPGLVLGTISSLAMPGPATRASCRVQAKRLNAHLYLAAAALVIGLLFLSALLRWPAANLQVDAARGYTSHVDAYIFYWGVTYTALIASYYVPIVIWLDAICRTVPPEPEAPRPGPAKGGENAGGSSDSPAADLFSWAKTLAALFAPAIAGLLGGVLKL